MNMLVYIDFAVEGILTQIVNIFNTCVVCRL